MIEYTSSSLSLIDGSECKEIINLGNHGFADSFFTDSQLDLALETVPLVCILDQTSGLVQLKNITKGRQRYQEIDYSYTASNSSISREHWSDFARYIETKGDLSDSSVLEIGSNDGYLLSLLLGKVKTALGVDASPFMSQIARSKGVECLTGIFGEDDELTRDLMKNHAPFNYIIANNVLNHANNPMDFLKLVYELLSPNGLFIFEVPYWYETVVSERFDQIYLEHVTYLTASSTKSVLEKCGLYLNEIKVVDYHGGSLRVQASKKKANQSGQFEKLQQLEIDEKLNSPERYLSYMSSIQERKFVARSKIAELRNVGRELFGIGAAAKANTLLTYFEFTRQEIPFLVEASPHKIGKITPTTLIPIFHDDEVTNLRSGTGVVLAWNISKVVRRKLLNLNPRLEFIEV